MIKSIFRKKKYELNIKEIDLLLLSDNIIVYNNIKMNYKNAKKNFIIPFIYKFLKSNSLNTKIS